ncbi:hypothetical protein M8756_16025 [Lutimaribacter sp. EGI FJ00015]|uniref:Uncharacterized protein n=1 Tax=Lutimaribacter degradans TaxID=2945989 RepID=A0ACC6A010_9RHOB|nr:hypothetical protein [Lutimaribacter sp. EGI FJ00013]MCM2563637.1 hypothetical protein [Lutimaribacter sp. EGI FJ00013]MCO0614827.1 hypothetical protein [Lutimaribacter sp. EGI FJ00015]MCO0637489.1 hypothetical protein [Lutimaribacter sp. EGI FJ00014]
MMYLFLLLLPLIGMIGSGSDDAETVEEDHDDDPDPDPNVTRTGQFVSDDLFGANAVYSINTDKGTPTETLHGSIEAFELENLRYPGGQAEPDGVDGIDFLDITQLGEDGSLRPELTDFLDNIEGGVTLVIPTAGSSVEEYGKGLADWTEKVMNDYGDKIDAFEIGNEYWSYMGETEYGQKADIAIDALAQGIASADQGDPDILVQMATPNAESEFHASVDDRGYLTRVTDANNAIIDQLSEESRANVDGVVEHYYWNDSPFPFDGQSTEVRHIDKDFEVWSDRFGRDLDLYITEWNIKANNDVRTGVQSLPLLTEMVENMVEMGVDTAHVWPINHNTTNDIGGSFDSGSVLTDDQGRVIENVRGAMFDLMAKSLPGKELLRLDLENLPETSDIAAYEGDGEIVLYIGSHSLEPVELEFDLRDVAPDFKSATGVVVGYDPATSDGQSYVPGQGMQPDVSVEIDGRPYYLTEHDTRALLTDQVFADPQINVRLLPYQVLELTIRN